MRRILLAGGALNASVHLELERLEDASGRTSGRIEVGFFSCVLSVLGTVFLFSRFTRKDTTLTTGDLFSLGKLVYTRFLVGSGLKAGGS